MSPRTSFQRFAAEEADRYGSDDWVWVRELLQNARDAGATRVACHVQTTEATTRITVGDNGEGMSLPHAREFLLALYASSKGGEEQAGRFGVGFWSVLRLEPDRIVIRSKTATSPGWEIEVRGDLDQVVSRPHDSQGPGTQIVLERRGIPPEEARTSLREALHRYGRFLMQRDDRGLPLDVRLEESPRNRPFDLPAPSVSFQGPGFRGVVGLGTQPSVELFSHGLLVRRTPFLRDLVEDRPGSDQATASGLDELPTAAPRVLLDSSKLDLMIARSDARQDRHLEELVERAEKELRRLIHRQLEAIRPQPWWRIVWGRLAESLDEHRRSWALRGGAVLAALLMGGALATLLEPELVDSFGPMSIEERAAATPGTAPQGADVAAMPTAGTTSNGPEREIPTGFAPAAPEPYRDLAKRYRGPSPASEAILSPIDLQYSPPDEPYFFSALRLTEGDDAAWKPGAVSERPYEAPRCIGERCLDITIRLASTRDPVRLPVPTGHRVDPESVVRAGQPTRIVTTTTGEPVLLPTSPPAEALVRYRTGPVRDIDPAPRPSDLSVPPFFRTPIEELQRLPRESRLPWALQWVARTIVYHPAPHLLAARDPAGWLDRAIEEGRGDCDVQNAALASLMRRAGVRARLAIGTVGARGRALPGLHAWAEVLDENGRWIIADASTPLDVPGPGATAPRSRTDSPNGDVAPIERPSAGSDDPIVEVPPQVVRDAELFGLGVLEWIGLVGLGLLALTARFVRRAKRRVHLGEGNQIPALLAGALRHPESFADLPMLRYGRFVPTLGDRAVSLKHCLDLARDGRLLSSRGHDDLSQRARDRGLEVLDLETEEAKVVAAALATVDLDEWSSLLAASRPTDLTRRLEALTREADLSIAALPVPTTKESGDTSSSTTNARNGARLLNLERHDLGRKTLLLSPDDQSAGDLPGLFRLLDRVVHTAGFDPPERSRVLAVASTKLLADWRSS